MSKRVNTSVWFDKYKRWQLKVQKNGIRQTFYSSTPGRKGQRECNQKADNWLDDNIVDSKKKIDFFYNEMLKEIELTTSLQNYLQYKKNYRLYVEPYISNVRAEDLTEQHLQTIINKAFSKGLAKKTLMNIKANIMFFMKFLRRCNVTKLFPENLTIPKAAISKEKIILQPSDLQTLFTVDTVVLRCKLKKDCYINAYRFAVITGLRPGELCGLQWGDINNGVVSIKRSINTLNIITTGKNKNAQRMFALNSLSLSVIESQKEFLVPDCKYVFPSIDGMFTSQSTLSKRWMRYRDQNNLSASTLYGLRHTFVSVAKELPEGLLKPVVGHSKTMDTFGIYGHDLNGERITTANLINDLFVKHINTQN